MSSVWNISVSESVSPEMSSDSSNGSIHSRIYGNTTDSSVGYNDSNINGIDLGDNSNSSSVADVPSVITLPDVIPPTFDLTDDTQPRETQELFTNEELNAEIASIMQFCETVENNLAEIGLGPVGGSSTPRNIVRRRRNAGRLSEPVDLTNLSNLNVHSSDRFRVPDAVIDLCSPEPRRHLPQYINLSDSPERSRRANLRRSFEHSYDDPVLVEEKKEFNASSPKQTCHDKDISTDDSYKCPVCLENVRKNEPSSTRCGHIFCKNCIEIAERTTHKCPLCNKRITRRSIFRIYL